MASFFIEWQYKEDNHWFRMRKRYGSAETATAAARDLMRPGDTARVIKWEQVTTTVVELNDQGQIK